MDFWRRPAQKCRSLQINNKRIYQKMERETTIISCLQQHHAHYVQKNSSLCADDGKSQKKEIEAYKKEHGLK